MGNGPFQGNGPFVNHVNMVYPPGQREAAHAFFETLGFRVLDTPPWLTVAVDPEETENWADNTLYAQEAVPAQKRFEERLARLIESDSELKADLERYKEVRRAHPQLAYHWGIHVPTYADWERRVAAIQEAARTHPLLQDRVEAIVFEPGKNPAAISTQAQAFIRTDVLAAEGFFFGLEIELQWTPLGDNGKPAASATGYFPPEEELA